MCVNSPVWCGEGVAQRGPSGHREAGSRSAAALAAGRIGDLEPGGRRAPRAAGYQPRSWLRPLQPAVVGGRRC